MRTRDREPLTPHERKQLRVSLCWTAAYLSVFATYFLIVLLDGVLDYAKLFGVREHDVWVFLSEVVAIPLFLTFQVCWALSTASAVSVIRKHPDCLVWVIVPPFVLFGGPLLLILILSLVR